MTARAVYIYLIVGTLFICWTIRGVFDGREAFMKAEQQRFLAQQQVAWAQEDAAWIANEKQKERKREEERTAELARVLGGPLAVAVKDPALDISQMLRQVAIACAPLGSMVSVGAERFTEFDIAVVLRTASSLPQLAEMALPILRNTVPYAHSLRFIYDNQVLGELDGAAINSVADWNAATVASVERLLAAADLEGQHEALAEQRVPQTLNTSDDLSPDQLKVKAVDEEFQRLNNEHFHRLIDLINDLGRAAMLDSIRTASQFQPQLRLVDQAAAQIDEERNFFGNPGANFETAARDQQLDPLLASIYKRDKDEHYRETASLYTTFFDALSKYQQQVRSFLAEMNTVRSDWSIEPGTGLIQFRNAGTRDMYENSSRDIKEAAQAVSSAIRKLSDPQRN